MNGLKSLFMMFAIVFSMNSFSTELGQQLLMDQDTYDEEVANKTNYKDVSTAAREFCATTFTDSSTYADAPPPGVIFACNEDALAEMFVSWFDYPRLEKMFALTGGEKDNAGKMAEALGFSKPTLKTVNISKDNVVVWRVINTILNYFVGIIFLFIVISFFNEARKLNSEFGLQSSVDAISMSMKKQWMKILALAAGMMMLSTFPVYLVILLAGMINFGAFLFFDPADEQGVMDKDELAPLRDSESIKYGNFMLENSLEGGQTAQYFLNTVDYESEIDKNWSVFNYDDPTKNQVFHFVKGVKEAANGDADFNNMWFSNLRQVDKLCFEFNDTYDVAGLNMLFDFVDNEPMKNNCLKTIDKTEFGSLVPKSTLAGVGLPGVDLLLEGATEYTLSLDLGNSIDVAINAGHEAGEALLSNYDEVFAMAKTSIETKQDVFSSNAYSAMVESYSSMIAPSIVNIDSDDLTTNDQQVLKALIANAAKEAMMGIQIPNKPPVPDAELGGEELYGEHSNYLINKYKRKYSDTWYEYLVSEHCSQVSNKEAVFLERNDYVNKFNAYSDSTVYKDIADDGRVMKLNNSETACIVYNNDGTKRVLGVNNEADLEELKVNRAAAELATRLISAIAFDASVEAYNKQIAQDSFAKEELQHFKRGFFGLFLNLQERAKNQNKLGRLNMAYNHYSFSNQAGDEYEADQVYDYVIPSVVGNYNPSTKVVKEMVVPDIQRTFMGQVDSNLDSNENGNFMTVVLDFFFEDYFYDCTNKVNFGEGSSYACADPTYMQVLLTAPKAIPQSIEIISVYFILSAIDVGAENIGATIKASGIGTVIAYAISAVAKVLQFIMTPLYYIALYIMLMSIIGLILTAFIPLSIIIDVMYSVLYFVFGILLLVIYVVPFSSLLGKDDEVQSTMKKILMKLLEPIFTVSIIIFYYFVVSGHLNGLMGALIFDILLSPYAGDSEIVYAIMYGMNVLIQITLMTVVFTMKDLTIISSIRGMVPTLINTDQSATMGYTEAAAIVATPAKMGQKMNKHLEAKAFKGHVSGVSNKVRGATSTVVNHVKGAKNRMKDNNQGE